MDVEEGEIVDPPAQKLAAGWQPLKLPSLSSKHVSVPDIQRAIRSLQPQIHKREMENQRHGEDLGESESGSKRQRLSMPPSFPGQEPPVLFTASFASIAEQRLNAIKRVQEEPDNPNYKKMLEFANEQMRLWAQKRDMPLPDDLKEKKKEEPKPRSVPAYREESQHRHSEPSSSRPLPYRHEPYYDTRRYQDRRYPHSSSSYSSSTIFPSSTRFFPHKKQTQSIREQLSGKHPVSALGELCRYKNWPQATYECKQTGRDLMAKFQYKVTVHDVSYTPEHSATTKKLAKAQSAQLALITLGYVKPEKNDKTDAKDKQVTK